MAWSGGLTALKGQLRFNFQAKIETSVLTVRRHLGISAAVEKQIDADPEPRTADFIPQCLRYTLH